MSARAFSEMTYYSALSWEKLGQRPKAKKLFNNLLAYTQKLQKTQAKIDYFATSLPTMLLFDDDLQFRQENHRSIFNSTSATRLGQKDESEVIIADRVATRSKPRARRRFFRWDDLLTNSQQTK